MKCTLAADTAAAAVAARVLHCWTELWTAGDWTRCLLLCAHFVRWRSSEVRLLFGTWLLCVFFFKCVYVYSVCVCADYYYYNYMNRERVSGDDRKQVVVLFLKTARKKKRRDFKQRRPLH